MQPAILLAASVAVGTLLMIGIRKWAAGGKCEYLNRDLSGKIAIVTGGNTGIGKETALTLAKLGAKVIIACRDVNKGNEVAALHNNLICMQLDLADLSSVRKFAAKFKSKYPVLHLLINNAGVMMCPFSKTKDGFEMQFGTNYLGHFLLTNLLLDSMPKNSGDDVRIINVASRAHIRGKQMIDFDEIKNPSAASYNRAAAYSQSKMANVMFTYELQRRLAGTGITVHAVHPGVVRTELARHFPGVLQFLLRNLGKLTLKSPWEGAQTTLHCALAPGLPGGQYFSDCKPTASHPYTYKEDVARKLWQVSEEMVLGVGVGVGGRVTVH